MSAGGHIQRRGKSSWRLKFDAGRDSNGERNTQYLTVRGTKAEAKIKLAELVAAVGSGRYLEPSRVTVGEFVRDRIAQWEAAGDISARTAERYRELRRTRSCPTSASSWSRSSSQPAWKLGTRRCGPAGGRTARVASAREP